MTQQEFLDALKINRLQADLAECQRLIRQSAETIKADKLYWELKKEEFKWWNWRRETNE